MAFFPDTLETGRRPKVFIYELNDEIYAVGASSAKKAAEHLTEAGLTVIKSRLRSYGWAELPLLDEALRHPGVIMAPNTFYPGGPWCASKSVQTALGRVHLEKG